jgi:hypothetical protein
MERKKTYSVMVSSTHTELVDAHPRLFPRLRPLEMPGDVAEPRRARKLAAHGPRRVGAHSIPRRRPANRRARRVHLRCVARSDHAQATLLDRLGVTLPKRMRLPEREMASLAAGADRSPPSSVVPTFRLKS